MVTTEMTEPLTSRPVDAGAIMWAVIPLAPMLLIRGDAGA